MLALWNCTNILFQIDSILPLSKEFLCRYAKFESKSILGVFNKILLQIRRQEKFKKKILEKHSSSPIPPIKRIFLLLQRYRKLRSISCKRFKAENLISKRFPCETRSLTLGLAWLHIATRSEKYGRISYS